jgi:hypothetical protein
VSGGWSPALHLASQAGGKAKWERRDLQAFLPPQPTQNWVAARAHSTGAFSTGTADRHRLGLRARSRRRVGTPMTRCRDAEAGTFLTPIAASPGASRSRPRARPSSIFQHDVTADDVRLAHQEGFVSVEHLKRYTTLGMATDQGKTSNVPGLAIMAEALGKAIPEVGTTRFRPPYAPCRSVRLPPNATAISSPTG